MIKLKNNIKSNKILLRLIVSEGFYFFSALLFLGFIAEFLVPGLFILYFNLAYLAILWILNLFLLILYVQ